MPLPANLACVSDSTRGVRAIGGSSLAGRRDAGSYIADQVIDSEEAPCRSPRQRTPAAYLRTAAFPAFRANVRRFRRGGCVDSSVPIALRRNPCLEPAGSSSTPYPFPADRSMNTELASDRTRDDESPIATDDFDHVARNRVSRPSRFREGRKEQEIGSRSEGWENKRIAAENARSARTRGQPDFGDTAAWKGEVIHASLCGC